MNILDTIVKKKFKEVENLKNQYPIKVLETRELFSASTFSMCNALKQNDASGIIAEIKRMSPSQGVINQDVSIRKISRGYVLAGASALSVLTDFDFFGGCNDDLVQARTLNSCPILRKEFIIDEYQVIEAKSIGADAILLIAAVLDPKVIISLTQQAQRLGMEVLLEVHDEQELMANQESGADMIGVNNRNLKTFEVSVNTSRQLVDKIPKEFIKISESGIDSVITVKELRALGYHGFLMGQNFMKEQHPEKACTNFILELRRFRAQ
ncbi:MAG: indole-3-glycerol phosphate synthase TrpC [Cyclobacteriaceae bacterium]|nr:indole-3-glycerol phosphate synthase TrpC [Cyclobacteriaceae bacterium]